MNTSKLILGDYDKCINPIISIMIPAFRSSDYLIQAIDSAINQSKTIQYEIVVVINDPEALLDELILRYKCEDNIYLYQNTENIGMVKNSNMCALLARGKYIAFLHDDDYLLNNYIVTINKHIIQNQKNIDCLITGRYLVYDGTPKRSEIIKHVLRKFYFIPNIYRRRLKKITCSDSLRSCANIYYSPSCGTVIKRDVFFEVGGFDESINYSFDCDFFLHINRDYNVYETTDICGAYRISDNASLKEEVRYSFFDYYATKYMKFFEDSKIDYKYFCKHKSDFLFCVYKQLGIDKMENISSVQIKAIGKTRLLLYRIKTMLYFYNHNLDIQRLR